MMGSRSRVACYDRAAKAPKAAAKNAAPKTEDEFSKAKQAILRKLTDPESARWGEFYRSAEPDANGLVCGAVNSKNRMGGYAGMKALVYWPQQNKAIMMYTGRVDPEYDYAAMAAYCRYCMRDPRAERGMQADCDFHREQDERWFPKGKPITFGTKPAL
jgi:hypothetical protein